MEMMNLTGSQRLRTAKLRRLLPIPFGTVSQPVPWRLRHRPASGRNSGLPHHPGFALSASRRTVRSRGGASSGIGFAAFTFPLTHE
jgi:hypothetical protein